MSTAPAPRAGHRPVARSARVRMVVRVLVLLLVLLLPVVHAATAWTAPTTPMATAGGVGGAGYGAEPDLLDAPLRPSDRGSLRAGVPPRATARPVAPPAPLVHAAERPAPVAPPSPSPRLRALRCVVLRC
ncbi:hypothetical protein [Streptomyces mexicanus]|uniref:hypothetical protein n=1 Tax=Streptomyces mexicanus TaxID=178566 RepID=UPI0036A7405B